MIEISSDELNLLQKIKLPYEINIDKKVSTYDYCLAIPKGSKSLAWFTNNQGENLCYIIKIDANNTFENIYIAKTSFDDKLSLGTLLYGTEFVYNSCKCFCIEDIFKFKGQNIGHFNFETKLSYLHNLFSSYLSQTALGNHYMIFGLPIYNESFSEFIYQTTTSAYAISHIQFRYKTLPKIFRMNYLKPGFHYFNNRNEKIQKNKIEEQKKVKKNSFEKRNKITDLYKIFELKAESDNDIYKLFENGFEKGIALIPDYKTSVYLNGIFRNIKENLNLDSLEESDDELEFENCDVNKFVDLNKSIKIKCRWESKFKKWVPCIE